MKRIFDPSFRYTPSYETDVRKHEAVASSMQRPEHNLLRLDARKAGSQ